jgi:hypothetical protein
MKKHRAQIIIGLAFLVVSLVLVLIYGPTEGLAPGFVAGGFAGLGFAALVSVGREV